MNKVELIGHYGGDITHAQSAWTSTYRDLTEEKKNRIDKLLAFLAKEGHHCYDAKTEILTAKGWKYFSQLTENDLVCAVNPKTHKARFEKPSYIYKNYYNEPMYYVKSQQLDLAVTKNHRMLVSQKRKADGSDYGSDWECQTSQEVSGESRKYLKTSYIHNNDVYNANFAKLIGFFIGDGYQNSPTKPPKFHIKKERKIKYLKSLGFEIVSLASNKYKVKLTEEQTNILYLCYNHNKEKQIPLSIFKLSNNDVNNIIEGLKNSDGSVKPRHKYKEWTYSTTSFLLKEQLKTLGCLHGFVFTEQKPREYKDKNYKTLYRLCYSNRIHPEISNMDSRKVGVDYWEPYSGFVYCVTVSTGFVMVRRNGHCVVSGNTPFEKSAIHFLITTDIASHIHLLKHRIAVPVNGESGRYKELKEDKHLIPVDWRLAGETEDEQFTLEKWCDLLKAKTKETNELYHKCLDELTPILGRKRAKESARFFKMYNSQITADVMFNFRSFAHFQKLRNDEHAQLEIRLIAQEMLELVQEIKDNPFEHTLKAFGFNAY